VVAQLASTLKMIVLLQKLNSCETATLGMPEILSEKKNNNKVVLLKRIA